MRVRLGFLPLVVGISGGACHPGAPAEPRGAAAGERSCASWVLRDMLPVCRHPLTAEQASHRTVYALLTSIDGKTVRVELRNGAGGFAPTEDGDVAFTVRHDADGARMTWVDRWGVPTREWRITGRVVTHLTPWGRPSRETRTDACVARYTLDARGFPAVIAYEDERGQPASRKGVPGWRMVRDEAGDILESAVFDASGAPGVELDGAHKEVRRLGPLGCVLREERYDVAGRPHVGLTGGSSAVRSCDAHGNLTSERWIDAAGAPAVRADGLHGWERALDAHGGITMETALGPDGTPADRGVLPSRVRFRLDARGYHVEETFLDPRGEPFAGPDGSAGVRYRVHANGARTAATFLDVKGRPVVIHRGYATWEAEYLPGGQHRSTRYLDAEGGPARADEGVPQVVWERDARGLATSQTFLDAGGRVTTGMSGFARVRFERDEEGHIVRRTHFDAEGAPLAVPAAITMWFTYVGAAHEDPRALSREEAQRRALEALSRVRAKEPFASVASRLGDPVGAEPRYATRANWYTPLWDAIVAQKPGDPPVLLDTERGFIIVQRTE